MNLQLSLFRRTGVFYCEDRTTRKQISLRTRDEEEAQTLLHAKNESVRTAVLNLQIARAYACSTRESALKLAERFIAGVTKTEATGVGFARAFTPGL
jgi:hypothetical protein